MQGRRMMLAEAFDGQARSQHQAGGYRVIVSSSVR